MNNTQNLGFPAGADYQQMLAQLQGTMGGGPAPQMPGLQGWHHVQGAGFLPTLPNVGLPQGATQGQSQAPNLSPQIGHGALGPSPIAANLGLGGMLNPYQMMQVR